jgi:hypothetical protein
MLNLWQFALDVQHVMTTRILRMMAGELTPLAQIAGALALLTGGPVAASREMIEVYRLTVSANCSRLSIGT